ncbi:hypothetical protein BZA77DRAFT_137616 [Pyronema omphalodes]|nr:hypothetical protein BZA77DRAFT_137616 [Pyronema omphalodes]
MQVAIPHNANVALFQGYTIFFDLFKKLLANPANRARSSDDEIACAVQAVHSLFQRTQVFNHCVDNPLLRTTAQLLDQCMMIDTSNAYFKKSATEWYLATSLTGNSTKSMTKIIHNFIAFAISLPSVYPDNCLTVKGLTEANRRVAKSGTSEAKLVVKRLDSALTNMKAMHQASTKTHQIAFVITKPEYIPEKVMDQLRIAYDAYLKMPNRGLSFDKVMDWYLKSTQHVQLKYRKRVNPKIIAVVARRLALGQV